MTTNGVLTVELCTLRKLSVKRLREARDQYELGYLYRWCSFLQKRCAIRIAVLEV